MLKNAFLDRDGIINEVVMRSTVVSSPRELSEFKVRQDFLDFYRLARRAGLNLFVISNQPDVARGLLSQSELQTITDQLTRQFEFQEIVYCCHDDQDACVCRKPKPGMINYLLEKFQLRQDESILIGDSHKDILAGQSAGLRTVLLSARYNRGGSVQPNHAISELIELFSLEL